VTPPPCDLPARVAIATELTRGIGRDLALDGSAITEGN